VASLLLIKPLQIAIAIGSVLLIRRDVILVIDGGSNTFILGQNRFDQCGRD
jgi:hypothetical protein